MDIHDSANGSDKQLISDVKVCITGETPFFGPGVALLLEQVDKTGSVRLACSQMNMSYSKGWKLLGNAERELGYRVVQRQQGGRNGGAAQLTPEGRSLLERYRQYELETKEAAKQIFARHFGDF